MMQGERQRDEEAAYYTQKTRALADLFMMLFARTIEVFLRFNFGERYFNGLSALASAPLLLGLILILSSFLGQRGGARQMDSGLMTGFLALFLFAAGVHVIIAKIQRYRGALLHSRYSGTPWIYWLIHQVKKNLDMPLPLAEHYIKLWVEPPLALIVGSIVAALTPPLGMWIIVASLCLWMRGLIAAAQAREKLLDMLDQHIEAESLAAAFQGAREPLENRGVEVWGRLTPSEQAAALNLATMRQKLDPALQSMMTPPTHTASPESAPRVETAPTASPPYQGKPVDPSLYATIASSAPLPTQELAGSVYVECPHCRQQESISQATCRRCFADLSHAPLFCNHCKKRVEPTWCACIHCGKALG